MNLIWEAVNLHTISTKYDIIKININIISCSPFYHELLLYNILGHDMMVPAMYLGLSQVRY